MLALKAFQESEFHDNLVNKRIICIDSSSFSNIDCVRKFFYGYILKKQPAAGRSPLIYGKMVHNVLERYYKTGDSSHEFVDFLIQSEIDRSGEELSMSGDEKRSNDTFSLLMQSYFNHTRAFGEYLRPLTLEDGTLAVEKSFSLPLGEVNVGLYPDEIIKATVMWEGKIDLVATDLRTNKIGIWDHKTASRLGETFLNDKMRSVQFTSYLWAISQLAPQLGTITEVGLNTLSAKSKGFEFQHFMFSRSPWNLEEWRHDTLALIQGALNQINIYSGHTIGNRNICCGKYGKCQFFDACEVAPHDRMKFLLESGAYSTSTWSPLGEE